MSKLNKRVPVDQWSALKKELGMVVSFAGSTGWTWEPELVAALFELSADPDSDLWLILDQIDKEHAAEGRPPVKSFMRPERVGGEGRRELATWLENYSDEEDWQDFIGGKRLALLLSIAFGAEPRLGKAAASDGVSQASLAPMA